jgi:uncharacterized RDD family membrane protein YckC
MPATLTVVTPENVTVTYELAGVASRFLAALVDAFIQIVAIGLLSAVAYLVGSNVPAAANVAVAVLIMGVFTTFFGYHILFEALWKGQSPGKRLLGLRVVRDGGLPVTFTSIVTRNLVRLVDFLLVFYGIGILSIIFSRQFKRLGDFAAGTIVVREETLLPPATLPPLPAQAAELVAPAMDVSAVSRGDYEAVRVFLGRAAYLPEWASRRLVQRYEELVLAQVGESAGDLRGYPLLMAYAAAVERRHAAIRPAVSEPVTTQPDASQPVEPVSLLFQPHIFGSRAAPSDATQPPKGTPAESIDTDTELGGATVGGTPEDPAQAAASNSTAPATSPSATAEDQPASERTGS